LARAESAEVIDVAGEGLESRSAGLEGSGIAAAEQQQRAFLRGRFTAANRDINHSKALTGLRAELLDPLHRLRVHR
jgi:hypothetical protein